MKNTNRLLHVCKLAEIAGNVSLKLAEYDLTTEEQYEVLVMMVGMMRLMLTKHGWSADDLLRVENNGSEIVAFTDRMYLIGEKQR